MSLGLWAGEIESRIAGSCAMRVAECCPQCGTEGLLSCNEEALRIKECGRRVIRCVCGMLMEERDCVTHTIGERPEVEPLCPQGCGECIRKGLVENHSEELCENIECESRICCLAVVVALFVLLDCWGDARISFSISA